MPGWLHEDLKISAWVLLPILLGARLARAGVPKRVAQGLFAFAFYGCQAAVTACAIWIARIDGQARLLPLLALSGWLVTTSLAWLVSRKLSEHSPKRGAFILSMAMSNNGFTLLGFVALARFGQAGLAQATYAQLLYTPFFLLCCFPLARLFGEARAQRSLREVLCANAVDPRVWVPLLAIATGLGLNAAHVARPALVGTITRTLIYLGTLASGCAVGLLFNGFQLRRYWREHLLSLAHRCTVYPFLYWAMARLVGLGALDTKILVLYGLVPSALLANMLAVFFGLDTDLTSSMFLVSTLLFLGCVLPVFLLAAGH